jgi:hypothetical protein
MGWRILLASPMSIWPNAWKGGMLGESTEAESTEYVVKEKYRKLTPIINYLTSLSIRWSEG